VCTNEPETKYIPNRKPNPSAQQYKLSTKYSHMSDVYIETFIRDNVVAPLLLFSVTRRETSFNKKFTNPPLVLIWK